VSRVLRPAQHQHHFGDGLSRQNTRTHNNERIYIQDIFDKNIKLKLEPTWLGLSAEW